MTPDPLEAAQARNRKRLGLDRPDSDPAPAPHEVTAPCSECGESVAFPILCKFFHTPPRTVLCDRCAARREEETAERRRQAQAAAVEAEKARRAAALAAVRADPEGTLARCGVPPAYLPGDLDNCPDLPGELVRALRVRAEAPAGSVLLHGTTGCGKTFAAVGILRAVLTAGVLTPEACRFRGERELLRAIRESYSASGYGVPPALSAAMRIPLLVYDDLGSARGSDWAREQIMDLAEERHRQDLPTVWTSNLSPEDLAKHLDPRLISRIGASDAVYELPARDLRLRSGQRRRRESSE